MADTTVPSNLQEIAWDNKFFTDYIQTDILKSLMGSNENAVIQVKEQLGKQAGDTIYISLINRLTNDATTGTTVLEGNEEDMALRSHAITVNKRRNAVRVAEMEEQLTGIQLRNAARATLLDWAMEDTRDLLINALGSLNGTNFTSRTSTIADAWLVANVDRTVFGAYAAGGSAGGTDLSADLAQLDTTADLFTTTLLDSMIIQAKTCSPKIRPMRDGGNGKRYYVVLAHPNAFKNLRDSMDTEVLALTSVEMQASKLFDGGDLFWNGCVIKEIDDLPIYANIGASGTTEVTPVYLLGAQALGIAYAKRWRTRTKMFDYDDKYGVAVDGIYGVSKIQFGTGTTDTTTLKDHGVVTGFFATTGTATVASAGEV